MPEKILKLSAVIIFLNMSHLSAVEVNPNSGNSPSAGTPQAEEKEPSDMFYYKSEYTDLWNKKKALEKEITDLKAKQNAADKRSMDETSANKTRLSELETELAVVNQKYAELYDKYQSYVRENEAKISSMDNSIVSLRSQKEAAERRYLAVKEEKEVLERELLAIRNQKDGIDKNSLALKEQNAQLEKKLKEQNLLLEQKNKDLARAEKTAREYNESILEKDSISQEQAIIYRDTISKIEQEKMSLQEKSNRLTEEVERLKEINKAYLARLEEANSRLQALESSKKALQKKLEDSKSDEAMLNSLRKENAEISYQRDELLNELEEMKKRVTDRSTELDRELNSLQKDYNAKEKELEAELERLKQRENELLAENSRLVAANDEIAYENLRLKEQLESINRARKEMEVSFRNEILSGELDVNQNKKGVVIGIPLNVTFDTYSSRIRPEGKTILDKIIKILNTYKIKKITIEGNTDDRPVLKTSKYRDNWELSTARAISVLRYLIRYSSIHPRFMTAAGNAEYNPLKANNTPKNRAANRRVEIVVTPAVAK